MITHRHRCVRMQCNFGTSMQCKWSNPMTSLTKPKRLRSIRWINRAATWAYSLGEGGEQQATSKRTFSALLRSRNTMISRLLFLIVTCHYHFPIRLSRLQGAKRMCAASKEPKTTGTLTAQATSQHHIQHRQVLPRALRLQCQKNTPPLTGLTSTRS